ncbi:MAG: 16S rRNA (guanine(527)-N(7))-methyltransferase RsmG [Rhodobacteraceae bacterium]|nr:16S rRNA (guanine(527)-N(7))-methyltransferase RsmG [Paracoccaceae bacterium]MCY4196619.1 16S rRNA (guanine(527)-N(7))-methyltransferase RsmG [Paracoccaceae bacterium]
MSGRSLAHKQGSTLSVERWLKNVSRETFERLTVFESLLLRWNRHAGLIAESTIPQLWNRHFLDSAQLMSCAPKATHWLDIGSGAGFPGLVLAILAADNSLAPRFTLIESGSRKCEFLRRVIRETGVEVELLEMRCEDAEPQNADAVTARAVASLKALLTLAIPHVSHDGVMIFPKGRNRANEIDALGSTKGFFDVKEVTSLTDPEAAILVLRRT